MSAVPNLAVAEEAAEAVPNVPGTPFGGGFYVGRYLFEDKAYALIDAPIDLGEIDRVVWKTEWQAGTPGAQSVIDGMANTEAMIRAGGHPIADWILQVREKWAEDAYIPARDELSLEFFNLKPGTSENWTYKNRLKAFGVKPGQYNGVDEHGNGHNDFAIPPIAAYTKKNPGQTVAAAYREGGTQAFKRSWYWSSTEFGPAGAWVQFFGVGYQYYDYKYGGYRARAVRKVLI